MEMQEFIDLLDAEYQPDDWPFTRSAWLLGKLSLVHIEDGDLLGRWAEEGLGLAATAVRSAAGEVKAEEKEASRLLVEADRWLTANSFGGTADLVRDLSVQLRAARQRLPAQPATIAVALGRNLEEDMNLRGRTPAAKEDGE